MKLHQSFTTVTPLSKILAMILFVSLPFIGFFLGNLYSQQTTVCPVTEFETKNQIDNSTYTDSWSTYSNPEIGIEFKYPDKFGTPKAEHIDATREELSYKSIKGKLVSIRFPSEPDFYISVFTDDYLHPMEFPVERVEAQCDQNLKVTTRGDYFLNQCKNLSLENGNYVMSTSFEIPECSPFFYSTIYLYNHSSQYKNIEIRWSSTNLNNKINYSCVDNNQEIEAHKRVAQFSQNIMSETNLDTNDQQSLSDFKTIAGSVEFN